MTKRQIEALGRETADYVIAHAKRQKKRNHRPSVTFRNEVNPQKALALAKWFKETPMAVSQVEEKQWHVFIKGSVAAQIHLDYQNQVDKVVLLGNGKLHQRCVKELILSHAIQFVIHRSPISTAILKMAPERELAEYTCENLMSFEKIPSGIFALSDEVLENYLSEFATVVEGQFSNPEEMLSSLLRDIYEKKGILLSIREAKWSHLNDDHIIATFEIKSEHNFKLWKNSSRPERDGQLHFVASYHPVMHGKKDVGMINGDTGYYIRGSELGIRCINPPEESKAGNGEDIFSHGWSKMKHPFYAEGKTLGVEISATLCMAKTGYQALYEFLLASLNQDDLYVSVCGGFNPPYDYPQNVLNRKRIPSPAGRHGSYNFRGSEHHCVWEHNTLKAEGVLDKSSAPDWFFREGWLKIYDQEEISFE